MVNNQEWIPGRGDLVWLDFTPQAGSEQAGRRPALVISPVEYNAKVGLALFCPITSQEKGYPFEVCLPEKLAIRGVVLTDHVKNLDWRARKAEYIGKIPGRVMNEVLAKLAVLIS